MQGACIVIFREINHPLGSWEVAVLTQGLGILCHRLVQINKLH